MRLGSPTSKSRMRFRLAPFDLFWAIVAPPLALALRDPGLLDPGDFPFSFRPAYEYAVVTSACAALAFLVFRINEGMSRYFSVHDVLAACGAVGAAVASSSMILFVFTRLEGVPRSTPVICGLVMIAGLLFARTVSRILHNDEWAFDSPTPSIHPRRRVLLIGVDRFAAIAIKLVDSQWPRTTEFVAALDPRPALTGRKFRGVKIVGRCEDIEAVIDEYSVHGVEIDEVWLNESAIALSRLTTARIREQCRSRGVRFAALAEALNLTPPIEPAARIDPAPPPAAHPAAYFRMKRLLDLTAASALMIFFAPLALVVAGLTLIDVGAPALFWQQRVGCNGRKFLLYKFRTYQAPFDSLGGRVPDDRRLSKIGRAIRATRLDELPQLLNVIVGDMSLVGPRPLLPQDQPADPRTRLSVRPGITGWAQVNGGAIVTPEDKDALDAWYVRHASILLDLRIIVSTLVFVVTGERLNLAAVEQAKSFRDAPADKPRTEPKAVRKVA